MVFRKPINNRNEENQRISKPVCLDFLMFDTFNFETEYLQLLEENAKSKDGLGDEIMDEFVELRPKMYMHVKL